MATLMSMILIAVGCPISWDRVLLHHKTTWIGWDLHLRLGTVSVTKAKMQAVLSFLMSFAQGRKTQPRQSIEAGVGLAMWLATLLRAIKPWLCIFITA